MAIGGDYLTPTLYRNREDRLPHVVWKLTERPPVVPESVIDAIVHVWNRFQCAVDGHDDHLWHLSRTHPDHIFPDEAVCTKCSAALTGCTHTKAHGVG